MSSPGLGGSLSAASDVYFNNPSQDNTIKYNSTFSKWTNGTPAPGATGPTGPQGPSGAVGPAGMTTINDLPSGSVLYSATAARPTTRSDIMVIYRGAATPTAPLVGDIRVVTD